MSFTHGMNVSEVQALGNMLKAKAGQIRDLVSEIESKVSGTTWEGPDAQAFKGQWWPDHKSHLMQVAEQVDGFGQSALNNATEQENASR
jgi:uncharacterized protein YukE